MKPYMCLSGKGRGSFFWGDKVKPKIKRIFKKSVRQQNKKINVMDIIVKRSDIELHRNSWKKVAEQMNWYKEPFYIQIWLKDDGKIDDSVSMRDVMTQDVIIPTDGNTYTIDEDN